MECDEAKVYLQAFRKHEDHDCRWTRALRVSGDCARCTKDNKMLKGDEVTLVWWCQML